MIIVRASYETESERNKILQGLEQKLQVLRITKGKEKSLYKQIYIDCKEK
jgi:hypothetical protein